MAIKYTGNAENRFLKRQQHKEKIKALLTDNETERAKHEKAARLLKVVCEKTAGGYERADKVFI